MSRILGVDPGIAALGWCVIERAPSGWRHYADGVVKTTPADGDDLTRVTIIYRALRDVIESHAARVVVSEAWRHYAGAPTTAAYQLGLVVAAVRLVALACDAEHGEGMRAQDWRTALGLSRRADKAEAQERVRVVLGLPRAIAPQHASDAAAVALAWAHSQPRRGVQQPAQRPPVGSDGGEGVAPSRGPRSGRVARGRGRR